MPLMGFAEFDRRPILVAIAGPNGAGKTTFFHAHLASAGLRFVNADVLAAELAVEPGRTGMGYDEEHHLLDVAADAVA